jgi:pimeloyl-ACP methyl ester carboxylesterase
MENPMPILLVPGLVCSPRYFAPVVPSLWRFGPVTVANHIRDDNMGAIARRMMERARSGEYHAVLDELFAGFVHPSRREDVALRQLCHDMGEDVGAENFVRQQTAMIGRVDSRPALAWIKCPTLVLSCDTDNTIPNALSKEMAENIHGAKLVILENCGHLPQVERPEATAAALVEWLQS